MLIWHKTDLKRLKNIPKSLLAASDAAVKYHAVLRYLSMEICIK